MDNLLPGILAGISGICWSVVYIECIRTGFKEKTWCMPVFALALNIFWEGIYSAMDLFVRQTVTVQAIANAVWFLLDIFIVVTWIKFGKSEFPEKWKFLFWPWTILVFAASCVLQILFIKVFGDHDGEIYSAFLQNIVMSVAFLYMLAGRKSLKGQNLTIAICKCIGTLTPTLLGALENNLFIIVTGIICFIFDSMYIWLLCKIKKQTGTVKKPA